LPTKSSPKIQKIAQDLSKPKKIDARESFVKKMISVLLDTVMTMICMGRQHAANLMIAQVPRLVMSGDAPASNVFTTVNATACIVT
jgi:hypothetical protein